MNEQQSLSIGLGEFVVGRSVGQQDDWVIYGLGSCIGLILSDPWERVVGMAHILLPEGSGRPPKPAAKYADAAIAVLLDGLRREGGDTRRFVAQIAGGANILQLASLGDIGQRNIVRVRQLLTDARIPIVAQSVGGTVGRTLRWIHAGGLATVKQIGENHVVLTPQAFRYRWTGNSN